ncbi:MAG: arsenic resistance N-acetyltransferase ArsN2 [Gemmatimonadaceae bacterium]
MSANAGGSGARIRAATAEDLKAVSRLLEAARLPVDGLEDQFGPAYAVAELDGQIVGAEGVERYADAGLLRSAVVAAEFRGRGLGDDLTRNRLDWARDSGLREVWLLTTTAADYFPRFGFERAERHAAPVAVRSSREFREACPASAVAMRLDLTQGTT